MRLKKIIECLESIVNIGFLFILGMIILCTILKIKCTWLWYILIVLFLLSMDNSLQIIAKQISHQRQFM
jgi:hypothetical protein